MDCADAVVADFDAFVRERSPRLRAIVASMAARSPTDADDLLQDALVRAYERRATFASEQHAANFVCHVVRCLLVDERRSWYFRNVDAAAEVTADRESEVHADPAEIVARADECRTAVRSMVALPLTQRQILWDHVVEGESYADIARRTATPLATVRSTARRARTVVLHDLRDTGKAPPERGLSEAGRPRCRSTC